jgi:hypothetical protein
MATKNNDERSTRNEASTSRKRRLASAMNDDDDERDGSARKESKSKKRAGNNRSQQTNAIKYVLWVAAAVGTVLFMALGWWTASVFFKHPDKMIDGVGWYKAPDTMLRFDMIFPGGTPTYDLIKLRNPDNNAQMRGELWQRRYQGRMYEACYMTIDNLQGALQAAANEMVNSRPPDAKAVGWQTKIVLNDGKRIICMRVYGPEKVESNDPMVLAFFNGLVVH